MKKSQADVKVGDLVVRLKVADYSQAKIGLIHRVNYVSNGYDCDGYIQYGDCNALYKKEWRFITAEEAIRYLHGNRYIDITKLVSKIYSIDNYSII